MKRSSRAFLIFFLSFILLMAAFPCHAYDYGKYLSINGFLSQGYIKSRHNNFLAESLDGDFELNEFALTFNSRIKHNLRLGLQLLSRDVGEEGNNDVLIDWAVADYRWKDWLGIRFGKVQLPYGLYNQGRDTEFLRPMALLPQSIYDENKRNLFVGAWGGNIYGNIPLGKYGGLDYQAYYGDLDFPEDSGQARGVKLFIENIAKKRGIPGAVSDYEADNKYAFGGSLVYSPPIDGLVLGVSYFTGKTDFTFNIGTMEGEATGHNRDNIVWSLEYTRFNWTLSTEYLEFTPDPEALGVDPRAARSQGTYVQLSYDRFDPVVFSALYDVFYANKNDRNGDELAAQGKPDYLAWRKDIGIGVRWNITEQWLVRAEHHWVDGASLGTPIWNPQGVEEDWSYFVLKASFNF